MKNKLLSLQLQSYIQLKKQTNKQTSLGNKGKDKTDIWPHLFNG